MNMRIPLSCVLAACLEPAAVPDISEDFWNDSSRTVVFLGNSITQNGRYIHFLREMLTARFPGLQADFINAGKSSETVAGLTEEDHPGSRPLVFTRLPEILAQNRPDLVFACYGMNDGIYHPFENERFEAYRSGVERLMDEVRQSGAEIILVTPPPFDSVGARGIVRDTGPFGYKTPYRNYDSVLQAYSGWLLSLRTPDQRVVDIHAPMNGYLETRRQTESGYTFAPDGIHPNSLGHRIMAEALLKGLFSDPTSLSRGGSIARAPNGKVSGVAWRNGFPYRAHRYRVTGRALPSLSAP